MKSLFSKKLATLVANINENIFENIVGYITAPRMKNILNDSISVSRELNKRATKTARWNFTTNTALGTMIAGATVNETVLYEDDIILLSGQVAPSENGLWLIQSGAAPVRPDFFVDAETQQTFIWVANLMSGQKERLFIVDVNSGAISVSSYFEDALLGGGSYRGGLTKSMIPSIPSKGVIYFQAVEKGTYTNAGNVVVTSELAIIKYSSTAGWSVQNITIPVADVSSKANIESPSFSGTPTVPTPLINSNNTQIANTAFVKAVVAALIANAPAALDTINEIATAINNDPNFKDTVFNALAARVLNTDTRLTDQRIPTDLSVSYNKVSNSLKNKSIVTNTIDLSANAIGTITLTANTAFIFNGFELNKSYLLIISTNGFIPSFANSSKHEFLDGNEIFENTGKYYVNMLCIDSTPNNEKLLTTIMKSL
jgi:hypothetical protein